MAGEEELGERFLPGEVVQLKSGGPFMTIIRRDAEDDQLYCSWFWSGRYQKAWFPPDLLMRPDAEAIQATANLKRGSAQ